MKIDKIVNINSKINFKSNKINNKIFTAAEKITDNFERNLSDIKFAKFSKEGFLKGVEYNTLLSPSKAIKSLVNSLDNKISQALLSQMHTREELKEMAVDVASDDFLRNLKVNKLIGLGAFALVFELDNGKILKLTNGEHFPDKRQPDFFDLPIEKQGKSSRTHYYIEEKTTHNNITQEELRNFVNDIEKKGYVFRDYLYFKENNDEVEARIREDQFGKTKDGKLYLIDPGCVIVQKKLSFEKLLKKFFKKLNIS